MTNKAVSNLQNIISGSILIKDLSIYFREDFLVKNNLIAYPLLDSTVYTKTKNDNNYICNFDNSSKDYIIAGITTERIEFIELNKFETLTSSKYQMLEPNVVYRIPKSINYVYDIDLEPPSVYLYANLELTIFGIIDTDLGTEVIAYKEESQKNNFLLDLIKWQYLKVDSLISNNYKDLMLYQKEIKYYELILKKQGFLPNGDK
jgi:hypothetical protein